MLPCATVLEISTRWGTANDARGAENRRGDDAADGAADFDGGQAAAGALAGADASARPASKYALAAVNGAGSAADWASGAADAARTFGAHGNNAAEHRSAALRGGAGAGDARFGNAADAAVGQFPFRAGASNCGGGQRGRMVLAAAGAGGSSGSAGGSAVPRRCAANAAGQRQPIWRMAADDAVLFAPARQFGGTPGTSALRRCADARGNADGESACPDGNARCLQCIRALLARHVLWVADFLRRGGAGAGNLGADDLAAHGKNADEARSHHAVGGDSAADGGAVSAGAAAARVFADRCVLCAAAGCPAPDRGWCSCSAQPSAASR